MHRVATVAIVLVLGACAEPEPMAASEMPTMPTNADMGPVNSAVECVPDQQVYTDTIAPIVSEFCGACHSQPLVAGAPFSLEGYDAFDGQFEAKPVLERVIESLSAGTMPPAGQARMRSDQRAALLDWASCGADLEVSPNQPNMGGDFDVDRPILRDPATAPENTDFFELRADGFELSPNARDRYECFTFEVPVEEDRFVRRIETIVGDSRVLHHAVLLPESDAEPGTHERCGEENPLSLIYGWAPGQGALQFDNGGIRIKPGQKVMLQIHYNNRAGHDDVVDRSGVRVYHGPPEGEEVAMLTLGPLGFNLPPRRTTATTGWCQLPNDTRVIASFPHMHELGIGITSQVSRNGGPEESLVTLNGWDFNSQYIYETPMELSVGDVIRTTCRYRNPNDEEVRFGGNTGDEMCFNFVYVTPPPDVTFCNQNQPPLGANYEPGECAPAGAQDVDVIRVNSGIIEGEPAPLTGGLLEDGLWRIDDAQIYIPNGDLGPFQIDYLLSSVAGFGVFALVDQRLHLDLVTQIHLVADGVAFDTVQEFSFAGAYSRLDDSESALGVAPSCGEMPNDDGVVFYQADTNGLQLLLPIRLGPVEVELLLVGRPVESN